MEAVHINTGPLALSSEETPRDAALLLQLPNSSGDPAAKQQAVLEAGSTSNPAGTKSACTPSQRPSHGPSSSSSSRPSRAAASYPFAPHSIGSSSTPRPRQRSSTTPQPQPAAQFLSLRSQPVAPTLSPSPSLSVTLSGKDSRPHTDVSTTATSSQVPRVVGPSAQTTPETSLVDASGKYITAVGSSTAVHHTTTLRELNSSFPSPVFRHRHTKSAGAQSTTYSQPVIVRTYTGPSHTPSNPAHRRRPSGSQRTGSSVAGSQRIIQPAQDQRTVVSVSSPLPKAPAANSSSGNAQGSRGWSLTNSLFGMARTRASKGGFLGWPWTLSSDSASAPDETKLPPLEAFTFQGFMADLQTTTDIRADLDRIAEICARSRYSLSNQYESHMAPHGSGTGFAVSAGQSRPKGRKKGASGPGGPPALQAMPSDDDERSSRGQRRRRGGMGGGRRRSAAYGTLETIMSSSRSSEEDKTKKKPAAEIAEQVRARTARETGRADTDTTATTGETDSSARNQRSGSGSSAMDTNLGKDKDATSTGSTTGKGKRDKGKAVYRPRPTTFAHAVMDSSRQKAGRPGSTLDDGASVPANPAANPVATPATPALLGAPAQPYTTDESADMYGAPGSAGEPSTPTATTHGGMHISRRRRDVPLLARAMPTRAHRPQPVVHIVHADEAGEASGISGLGQGTGTASAPGPSPSPPGPSHAEGSLRELLKSAEASTPDKGKGVGL